ncbi:hypothetical protein GUJ93_ZPchr0003g17220 [Zizania palustris]|uniref:Uncharacterized protein n=1 Tax=Zizania palustris TaxID=103762 RepID=A0A8J5S719_ZIZPA|nr:hypothetical protein GUJ93_ZPchr0003g17220 [Zizania palustris]
MASVSAAPSAGPAGKRQASGAREGDQLLITPLGAGNEVGRSCVYMSFKGRTVLTNVQGASVHDPRDKGHLQAASFGLRESHRLPPDIASTLMGYASGVILLAMYLVLQCSWWTLLGFAFCTLVTTPVKKIATCELLNPPSSPLIFALSSQLMVGSSTNPAMYERSASLM